MNETTQETPEVSTPAATETPAKNPIDLAIESVMDLVNALGLFATITRGALGSGVGLVCEVAPSVPQEVFYWFPTLWSGRNLQCFLRQKRLYSAYACYKRQAFRSRNANGCA